MLSDFSDERAGVVRRLNAVGIPVVGIPLLPLERGYYFTADNAAEAAGRAREWKDWSGRHGLVWAGLGLDIEPDARVYRQIMTNRWGLVPMLVPRLCDRSRPPRAAAAYAQLVAGIRADGWSVENYQFPLIADERRAGSTLLQRLALVDVRTDREVWMIYSSFMRALGPGLIWSYGPEAAAIGVGTTGGGPDIPGSPQMPSLSWEELARDLRLAVRCCDHILIHSLEGRVDAAAARAAPRFDELEVRDGGRGQSQRRLCPLLQGRPAGRRARGQGVGQFAQRGDADFAGLDRAGEGLQVGAVDEIQGHVGAAVGAFAVAVAGPAADAPRHRQGAGQYLGHHVAPRSTVLPPRMLPPAGPRCRREHPHHRRAGRAGNPRSGGRAPLVTRRYGVVGDVRHRLGRQVEPGSTPYRREHLG